jgi:hypothetical protein
MTKANAEDGRARSKLANHLRTDAGIFWPAWPGRNTNPFGLQFFDVIERDFVIASNHRIDLQLAKELDKIVGKRIVVIDDEQHL